MLLSPAYAQDSIWTLTSCINYALDNSIDITEKEFANRLAQMQLLETRLSQLPGLSSSASYGKSWGRSINPTTNEFENRTYGYAGLNGSANVLLFGWFKKRQEIQKSKLLRTIATAEMDQLKDDLSLNVATAYLRILLATEQTKIGEYQIEISLRQVRDTKALIKAGRSNGLDLSQVETQLTADSVELFSAQLGLRQAILDLKAMLNLPMDIDFSIRDDDGADVSLNVILEYSPLQVYEVAVARMGSIKSASTNRSTKQKDVRIAQANLLPQLNMGVSAGSNYSSTFFQRMPNGELQLMPLGRQLESNFSQSMSVSLSLPLFNGLNKRFAVKRAEIDVLTAQKQYERGTINLQRDVYKAHSEARIALESYNASLRALETAKLGYEYAQKRFDKGLISAVELLAAKNTEFKSLSNVASSRFQLYLNVFVIDYYLGHPLVLE